MLTGLLPSVSPGRAPEAVTFNKSRGGQLRIPRAPLQPINRRRIVAPGEDSLALLDPIRHWLNRKVGGIQTSTREVRGVPATVINTRPDVNTEEVFTRLDSALGLIEQYTPHYFRHLQRDFARIVVQRFACRGAYFSDQRTCLLELTFAVNPGFSDAQRAATILHEAMHARLHTLGASGDQADRPRQERFCRRAEIEFGSVVPDGEPIVQRALASLEGSDLEVAPTVDPQLAARRIAQADLEALPVPSWVKKKLARRADFDRPGEGKPD